MAGDLEDARAAYQKAVVQAEASSTPNESAQAELFDSLATLERYYGDMDMALVYHRKASAIARRVGGRMEVITTSNLGNLFHDLGDDDRALRCWDEARIVAASIGMHAQVSGADLGIAVTALDQGRTEVAHKSAVRLLGRPALPPARVSTFALLCLTLRHMERHREACIWFAHAYAFAESKGLSEHALYIAAGWSAALADTGDLEQARSLSERVTREYRALQDEQGEIVARLVAAHVRVATHVGEASVRREAHDLANAYLDFPGAEVRRFALILAKQTRHASRPLTP